MSRKSVPKRKGGIPLDELLAAHETGNDARLDRLVKRYGRDVLPASSKFASATPSTTQPKAPKPSTAPKTTPARRKPEKRAQRKL